VAGAFRLLPARPNPFRGGTDLRFSLPNDRRVWIDVYDVAGRRIASPAAGLLLPSGRHAVTWDGRDLAGDPVPSGVYFVRLEAGGFSRTGKILRLR
jgi:flagellar hook assembly protein FlgD